jgi:hypothetical protein
MAAPAKAVTPAAQCAAFLAQFPPGVRATMKAALATMRKHLPGAVEFVYRTYALVVGFGLNERPSDALFSVVAYSNHVTLCFLNGALLDDPDKLLKGSGNQVRHIRLEPSASVLDRPGIRALIRQAITSSDVPVNATRRRKVIIRSVSKKYRNVRPRSS